VSTRLIPPEIIAELNRRRDELLQHPESGQTWDEVEAELMQKYETEHHSTDRTDSPRNYSLSPGVKAELDRRREEYLRDPSTAVSVDETFDELMNDARNATSNF